MKRSSLAGSLLISAIALSVAQAQSPGAPTRSPKSESRQQSAPVASPTPPPVQLLPPQTYPPPSRSEQTQSPGVVVGNQPETKPDEAGPASTERRPEPAPLAARPLSPQVIQARIVEAERMLKSRPLPTAMTSPSIQLITLAALDRTTSRVHLITLYKDSFLNKGGELTMTSSLGVPLSIRILRSNFVNTAVAIFDGQGNSLVPLAVEYPIEKKGIFREMAYYTSAHPALLSPELARSGRAYVHRMLELAAHRLRDKGKFVSPQILGVAERLCLVEHVDHERFRQENRLALFDEVYSLYALNEPDTYRYSVSTAGAGGMVQMIPWAYNLIKQRHPQVGLTPDFVMGMRNHANALEAMLLYMQDTWNDLAANEDVQYALSSGLATQPELLAAGYNSNAARLPGYLRRGGSSWRVLIPRETQMYLQIYQSVEDLVPQKPPTSQTPPAPKQ
jgi:hypothetical protein